MTRIWTLWLLIGCVVLTNLAGWPQAGAQEPNPAQVAAIAPFLNDQTIAVAAIDIEAIGNVPGMQSFLETLPDNREFSVGLLKTLSILNPRSFHNPADGKVLKKPRPAANSLPADEVKQVYLVAIWPDLSRLLTGLRPNERIELPLFSVVPGATKEIIAKLRALLPEPGKDDPAAVLACREINACAVIADTRLLDRLATLNATGRPEFAEALAAAGERPVRIAVAPPPLFARAASEILQAPALGADRPLGQYLADMRWIAIGIDPAADSRRLEMRLALTPTGDRDRMLDFLGRIASVIDQQLVQDAKRSFPDETVPALPAAKVDGDQILWTLDEPFQWLVAHIPAAKAAADLMRDSNRLKQIALALHTDYDIHKRFPDVAIRDRDGKPLLSWRVAILPYIDGVELYKQFHLNEPWDSEHNRKLIDQMPDGFRSDRTGQGRTRFLAPVGENLAFSSEKGQLNFKSFTDGTSKTILVVEADADHAVVWTKPEDLAVDLENPKRGITDGKANFLTVFVDGFVHDFKGSIRPEILRAMFTRNGGEIYDIDNIYPAP